MRSGPMSDTFTGVAGERLGERELVQRLAAAQAQRLGRRRERERRRRRDDAALRRRELARLAGRAVAVHPGVEARDVGEALHEVQPAELAVHDDREVVALLLGDEVAHGGVLDRPQAVVGQIARLVAGHGVHELRRAQHRAHVVHAQGHVSSLLTR